MDLIIDFYQLGSVHVLSESKDDGTMKIRGVYGKAEEFNNNNRRYPKTILEREINKLLPLVNESRLLGELDHPETATVKLTNAAHLVTKLYWQGNTLFGESKLLNTPAGKVAQQLLKDGVKLGVSSRGLGSLTECREFPGKLEVNEDYKMVTFDLVADPSTKGAFPSPVNESVLLQKTRKEAFSQQLMIKLFENKLSELRDNKIHKLFEGSLGYKRTNRIIGSKKFTHKQKDLALTKRELKDNTRPSTTDKESAKRNKKLKNESTVNEGSMGEKRLHRKAHGVSKKGHKAWAKEGNKKAAKEAHKEYVNIGKRVNYKIKDSAKRDRTASFSNESKLADFMHSLNEGSMGEKKLFRKFKSKLKKGKFTSNDQDEVNVKVDYKERKKTENKKK